MIVGAGVVTAEVRDAIERVRARAEVRAVNCEDEPAPERDRCGRYRRAGTSARIREVLKKGPLEGMTSQQVTAAMRMTGKQATKLARYLHAMPDVETVRAGGRPYRYRIR